MRKHAGCRIQPHHRRRRNRWLRACRATERNLNEPGPPAGSRWPRLAPLHSHAGRLCQDDRRRSDLGLPDRTAAPCRQPPDSLCAGARSGRRQFGQCRGLHPRRSAGLRPLGQRGRLPGLVFPRRAALLPAIRGQYRTGRYLAWHRGAFGGVEHRQSAAHDAGLRHGLPAIRHPLQPRLQRSGAGGCRLLPAERRERPALFCGAGLPPSGPAPSQSDGPDAGRQASG